MTANKKRQLGQQKKIEILAKNKQTLNLTARVECVKALHKSIYLRLFCVKDIEKEASLQDQKKFSI
jgi:hypothetical protein